MNSLYVPWLQEEDRDLTVRDYSLKHGMWPFLDTERAMLNALADQRDTLGRFIERVGADEFDFALVELYADEGAFTSDAYYPALANLRRSHPEAGSLVRRARHSFQEHLARHVSDPTSLSAPESREQQLEEALDANQLDYVMRLSAQERQRFKRLWS